MSKLMDRPVEVREEDSRLENSHHKRNLHKNNLQLLKDSLFDNSKLFQLDLHQHHNLLPLQ